MKRLIAALSLVIVLLAPKADASEWLVGGGRPNSGFQRSTIAAAANACVAGDTISVDAGNYTGDIANFTKANLYVRRAPAAATKPHVIGAGALANNQGLFHASPACVGCVFDGFEISGAAYPNNSQGNGAAIWIEGVPGKVTVRNCYLHDNQISLMTVAKNVLAEYNEIYHETPATVCDPTCRVGFEHCVYVLSSACDTATFQYNYFHQPADGNTLKSRAKNTFVLYNRLADENRGDGHEASLTIDLADGGTGVIVGNVIEQGPNSPNFTIIGFALEGGNAPLRLDVVNNTIVNDASGGTFINARAGTAGKVMNNIFYGPGTLTNGGTFTSSGNQQFTPQSNQPFFVDESYEFHLTSSTPSSIINAGVAPGKTVAGFDLVPTKQYVYNTSQVLRPVSGALDLGAFELGGTTSTTVDTTYSYFVPQAGPVNTVNTLEGAQAIAYAVTCPNNDLLNNGARLKIVLANSDGSPLAGVPAANIWAQFNGGTVAQGFTGAGDDTVFANSQYTPITQCPDLRMALACCPTDAAGVTYLYWKGQTGTRTSARKWGMFAGDIPIFANGVQLRGRLTTLDVNGSYTAHVKNVDTSGTEAVNAGELVNSLDLSPVQAAVGGAYVYKYDFNNDGVVDDVDVQFVRSHTNHRCDYPLNP